MRRALALPFVAGCHGPISLEQVEISVVIVLRGRRVEDEVEVTRILLEGTFVFRGDEVISTEAQSIVTLVGRVAEHRDMGSERVSELDSHTASTAQTHYCELTTGSCEDFKRRVAPPNPEFRASRTSRVYSHHDWQEARYSTYV